MKKISLLYIVETFGIGGVETVVVNLANEIDKNKFDVHVLVLSNSSSRLSSFDLLHESIHKHYFDFDRNDIKTLKFWFIGLMKLIQFLQNIKPDIVHTHLFFAHLFFVSIGLLMSRINCLHFRTIHISGFYYINQHILTNKIRVWIEKLSMKMTETYLICVSKSVKKNTYLYFNKIVKDSRIIHNGIDLTKYNRKKYVGISKKTFKFSSNDLIVSYVARLDDGKNHDFLIDIWGDVIKKIPNAILCFAGDGILRDKLIEHVHYRNLQDNIKFLGSLSNVPEFLSISDFAVFPSSFEGFGLVMLEKFAMGLAVVASDIESFQEIAENDISAFLVSLHDKQKYINSIVLLGKDILQREKMSKSAYSIVKNFSIKKTVKEYEKYYLQNMKSVS